MSAKCELIRAGANINIDGKCDEKTNPPSCSVINVANLRQSIFYEKYNPMNLFGKTKRDVRRVELGDYQRKLATEVGNLQKGYSNLTVSDVKIDWDDFVECKWNADGSPGGPYGHKYIDRLDLQAMGYVPKPIIGGKLLSGKLPTKLSNSMPIWLDKIFNPDLAVLVIFLILMVILAILLAATYSSQDATTTATSLSAAELEEYRDLIPVYEARGYCMEKYREKLGMPVTNHCAG